METLQGSYQQLMQVDDISSLSIDAVFELAGSLIDISGDIQAVDGLDKAVSWLEDVSRRDCSPSQTAIMHYFWANAWENRHLLSLSKPDEVWAWEQEELFQEIIHLRYAVQYSSQADDLSSELMCRIYTNLGNLLSQVGRVVEAISYWDEALVRNPRFGMALGNRGIGLIHYAYSIYGIHDGIDLLKEANKNLSASLTASDVHDDDYVDFQEHLAWTNELLRVHNGGKHVFNYPQSFGNEKDEIDYKKWIARHHLFLNHLNDIDVGVRVAEDDLLLPPIKLPIGTGPRYHGLFNQLKQEYVSARYFFYYGITIQKIHIADKRVLLCNTLDYPSYGFAIEGIKVAYRLSYSLFDKIAFFINDYLTLAISERKVSFRTCWYISQRRDKGLRSELAGRTNWPLRGLYWLSKDLYENQDGFRDAMEPDAQELADLRNHLEHKYLKVHELEGIKAPSNLFHDNLAYPITRRDLEDKVLRILKMTRAALIYLSMLVAVEERNGADKSSSDVVSNMELPLFPDDWKL